MIDLTPLRKFEVVGSDAEVFMQYAITRNVRRVSVGKSSIRRFATKPEA